MESPPSFSSHDNLAIVFYDGDCSLCSRTVSFILKHDTEKLFHFHSLQSKEAQLFLKKHHVEKILFDTLYLHLNNQIYNRSDAALHILKNLPAVRFTFLAFFLVLFPKSLRDYGYKTVSRNRHHFFKNSSCTIVSPEDKKRFLDN